MSVNVVHIWYVGVRVPHQAVFMEMSVGLAGRVEGAMRVLMVLIVQGVGLSPPAECNRPALMDSAGREVPLQHPRPGGYRASGSGRNWKRTTLGLFSLPPSTWNGVRVELAAHSPRPFQPALGSSMRPSAHLAKKVIG
jgi:hypothetical protein